MTTTEHDATTALTKLDQLAWEAPALRPVHTKIGAREKWAHPCPSWCTGNGPEHDVAWTTSYARRHVGTPLFVRRDSGVSYYLSNETEDADEDVVVAANLEVFLIAASRDVQPKIHIRSNWGAGDGPREGERVSHLIGALYFDEVRELIAALQHMMKVGQGG